MRVYILRINLCIIEFTDNDELLNTIKCDNVNLSNVTCLELEKNRDCQKLVKRYLAITFFFQRWNVLRVYFEAAVHL